MEQPLVIVIAGLMCAGKTSLSRILNKAFRTSVYSSSKAIGEHLDRLGQPRDRVNFDRVAMNMIREGGYGAVLDPVFTRINKRERDYSEQFIVIEGIRFPEQVGVIRRRFAQVRVFYIDAAFDIRLERVRGSPEKGDERNITSEAFLALHQLPSERRVPAIQQLSDITIVHESGIDDLRKRTLLVMKNIV